MEFSSKEYNQSLLFSLLINFYFVYYGYIADYCYSSVAKYIYF